MLVSTRFHVLFHSPRRGSFHLSLAVLVHYRSLAVFSLTRWSWWIRTGFHVSRTTWDTHEVWKFSLTGLSPSVVHLSRWLQLTSAHLVLSPATPATLAYNWFRLLRVRSPLLTESLFCFLFFRVLRCFSSPACLEQPIYSVEHNWTLLQLSCLIRKPACLSL